MTRIAISREHQNQEVLQTLRHNICAERNRQHLSQTALAERMQYYGFKWTQSTVSNVERSPRNITVDELFGVCEALDLTFDDLLIKWPQR